jgi:hypothetical protein
MMMAAYQLLASCPPRFSFGGNDHDGILSRAAQITEDSSSTIEVIATAAKALCNGSYLTIQGPPGTPINQSLSLHSNMFVTFM